MGLVPLKIQMIIELFLAIAFPILWYKALEIKELKSYFLGCLAFIGLSFFYLSLTIPSSIFIRVICEEAVKTFHAKDWKQGAASGLGFAMIENLIWALQTNIYTITIRGLFTSQIHLLSSALISTRKILFMLVGLLIHINWNLVVNMI